MEGQTSIGPGDTKPATTNRDHESETIVEGVDAIDENEFDMSHGLLSTEVKPQSPDATERKQAKQAEKQNDRAAAPSEPLESPGQDG